MKLFHASNCIVDNPDVLHSRDFLDFGKGFYLTALEEQARKYALRFLLHDDKAYLNCYELDDSLSGFVLKSSVRMMKTGWISCHYAVLESRKNVMM